MNTVKKAPSLTWKVVWYVIRDYANHRQAARRNRPAEIIRCVAGRRTAVDAWRLFHRLRGGPNVARGPELWRGTRRMVPPHWVRDNKPID